MKAAVIVFPGSNCDRDAAVALERVSGSRPAMIWHRDATLPPLDLIVVPGGFSYGDYLRSGAMAARSPVMDAVRRQAERGVAVLGVCNGFQVLTEIGLLPGALMRNRDLRFVSRTVRLRVETTDSPFTGRYGLGQFIRLPVAHQDGNYFADNATLRRLEDGDRVVFRYAPVGDGEDGNPNGSAHNIAGVLNHRRNVLGMMPHPERAADPALGNSDGLPLFEGLLSALGSTNRHPDATAGAA